MMLLRSSPVSAGMCVCASHINGDRPGAPLAVTGATLGPRPLYLLILFGAEHVSLAPDEYDPCLLMWGCSPAKANHPHKNQGAPDINKQGFMNLGATSQSGASDVELTCWHSLVVLCSHRFLRGQGNWRLLRLGCSLVRLCLHLDVNYC